MTDRPSALLRQHAEQEYAEVLAELAKADDRQRPPSWKLSPWAVKTYLMGGKLSNGFTVSPKYVGNGRLMEMAVATLATDRTLLLYGIPGTAKSWVSEHLAAAVSGDSTLLIQGTAGTDEAAIRYGWNYARLLTEDLQDPVDLLFGTQLGGGNDTPRALAYCQSIITRPAETVMVLVTECYEGGLSEAMLERTARIVDSGVTMVCLLALGDDRAPSYDRRQAAAMASLGVPTFACTPDLLPGMMAAAIQKQDLDLWAARHEIVTARGS